MEPTHHSSASGVLQFMWSGLDPELRRQLDNIRMMVARSHQTPTQEWPLIFVEDHKAVLVVREWPDGEMTAYYMPTGTTTDSVDTDTP
jgi:hypothetical protein